jgi:hypothetical protein
MGIFEDVTSDYCYLFFALARIPDKFKKCQFGICKQLQFMIGSDKYYSKV